MAPTLRSLAPVFALAATIFLSGIAGAAEDKHAGMVLVPAGEFTMGRDGGPPEEGPAHKLFLPAFRIDRNLVTMKEYARFIRAKGPVGPKGEQYLDVADDDNRIHQVGDTWQVEPGWEDYPASEMAWHGAVAYCKWLEKQLPSEAEWEKAARGTDRRLYPWGNDPPRAGIGLLRRLARRVRAGGPVSQGAQSLRSAGHGRPGLGVDPLHRNALSLQRQGRAGGSLGALPQGDPGRQRRQRSRGAHRHLPAHRGPRQAGQGARVLRLPLRIQGRDGVLTTDVSPPCVSRVPGLSDSFDKCRCRASSRDASPDDPAATYTRRYHGAVFPFARRG